MGTIILPPTTKPAVALLAQVLWNAMLGTAIQTPTAKPWPVGSCDFSALGDCQISIDGNTGAVTFAFAILGPAFTGTLDPTLLEAQLTTSPNFLSVENDGAGGRPGSLTGATVSFGGAYSAIARQRSGFMYVSAELSGVQSAQDVVSIALYRDSGPGQVQLGSWSVAPGGLNGFNWSAHITAIDVLPDASPHQYFIVATGSGGSTLTVPASASGTAPASLQVFELGGPG